MKKKLEYQISSEDVEKRGREVLDLVQKWEIPAPGILFILDEVKKYIEKDSGTQIEKVEFSENKKEKSSIIQLNKGFKK